MERGAAQGERGVPRRLRCHPAGDMEGPGWAAGARGGWGQQDRDPAEGRAHVAPHPAAVAQTVAFGTWYLLGAEGARAGTALSPPVSQHQLRPACPRTLLVPRPRPSPNTGPTACDSRDQSPAAAAAAGGGQSPRPCSTRVSPVPPWPLSLCPPPGLTWTMALEPMTSRTCPLRLVPLGSMKFTISAYWANWRDRDR